MTFPVHDVKVSDVVWPWKALLLYLMVAFCGVLLEASALLLSYSQKLPVWSAEQF